MMDGTNYAVLQESIANGSAKPTLADAWNAFPALCDDRQKEIVKLFLTDCDAFIMKLITTPGYTENSTLQNTVSTLLTSLAFLFVEPFNPLKLLELTAFAHFIANHSLNMQMLLLDLKVINQVNTNDGFTTVTNNRKRPLENNNSSIPLANKFKVLEDQTIADNGMDTENRGDVVGEHSPPSQKNKIHPFYVEIKGHWHELASKINDITENNPLIKMDGELLKIHCKSDNDFRKTQSYLDQNSFAYTTLSPNEQRPRKIVIRGIPPFTEPKLIIDALKERNFSATRAAMIKSRRTGKYMPIYVVNVLPRANFEEIFEIKDICYIRVTVERFKGANIVKQCYKCQRFGHASEICRFEAKCAKCAGSHLTPACPSVGKITPKCANCSGEHPSTYRGCPKTPQFRKKNSNNLNAKGNTTTIIPSMMTEILSSYNYVKKTKINDNTNAKVAEPDPKPNTDNVQTENAQNTPINSASAAPQQENNSNYTTDFQEIFKTFQEMKELLKFSKFIQCFKNLAKKIKTCKDPIQKMFIIANEFDDLVTEFNTVDNE